MQREGGGNLQVAGKAVPAGKAVVQEGPEAELVLAVAGRS